MDMESYLWGFFSREKECAETMKLAGYYSSGEFANKAHITKKTIRYYDEHNILKPSFVNENGARFYTDEDFARLQQILFLKYLGFSLDDIREMTMRNGDRSFLAESLHMQLGLMEERLEQMQLMKQALQEASEAVDHGDHVDWSQMLQVVNVNEMEQKLKNQYLNSSNISARINLHKEYAANKKGWFPWLFEQCRMRQGDTILELGCGDASLWLENRKRIPKDVRIILSDLSDGMMRDVKRSVGTEDQRFRFDVMDAHQIHMPEGSVDLLLANHVLFYCEDIQQVFQEVKRVLKSDGIFVCSTYSSRHMKEISELVQEFDDRIVLSADRLYERFGKENGEELLQQEFDQIQWIPYEDHLNVTDADALIAYVLSCHGNQNRYIVDRYREFRAFVKKKTEKGFYITKDAGIFVVEKG